MESTEAKVGKIFILIGFILAFVGAFFIIIWSAVFAQFMPVFLSGIFLGLGVVQVIGAIVGVFAFKATSEKKYHQAGVLGIVSSVIPPLNIFTLVGGILCLVSREARH